MEAQRENPVSPESFPLWESMTHLATHNLESQKVLGDVLVQPFILQVRKQAQGGEVTSSPKVPS